MMFPRVISKLFGALFIFGLINNSGAQTTIAECEVDFVGLQMVDCPPWEDGAPTYPYNCRKFIVCTNGNPIVPCCPPFTVWDQNLLVCNHESVTPCVIVTTTEYATDSTTTPTTTPTTITPTTTTPTTTTPTTTTPTTTTPTTTTPTTTRQTTTPRPIYNVTPPPGGAILSLELLFLLP
ncbi:salivary glue protein Sgs-3-like [Folsomia candida]|uniref:salivary glue protein Sgs-3-like n=1 Tax=Folsomia candida TaxID=158441 RepID=UPI001604F56A|nr:salivary glue protein Sgs-3-like [Folsomia candida]